jgi:hypothetical protein
MSETITTTTEDASSNRRTDVADRAGSTPDVS